MPTSWWSTPAPMPTPTPEPVLPAENEPFGHVEEESPTPRSSAKKASGDAARAKSPPFVVPKKEELVPASPNANKGRATPTFVIPKVSLFASTYLNSHP